MEEFGKLVGALCPNAVQQYILASSLLHVRTNNFHMLISCQQRRAHMAGTSQSCCHVALFSTSLISALI